MPALVVVIVKLVEGAIRWQTLKIRGRRMRELPLQERYGCSNLAASALFDQPYGVRVREHHDGGAWQSLAEIKAVSN